MFVHVFGAYFGLAVARMLYKEEHRNILNETSSCNSDLFAMIGTLFLWCNWPSFNSAPAETSDAKHRAVINTYLALVASCIASFMMSSLYDAKGKLKMVTAYMHLFFKTTRCTRKCTCKRVLNHRVLSTGAHSERHAGRWGRHRNSCRHDDHSCGCVHGWNDCRNHFRLRIRSNPSEKIISQNRKNNLTIFGIYHRGVP